MPFPGAESALRGVPCANVVLFRQPAAPARPVREAGEPFPEGHVLFNPASSDQENTLSLLPPSSARSDKGQQVLHDYFA